MVTASYVRAAKPKSREGAWMALVLVTGTLVASYFTFGAAKEARYAEEVESAFIQKHQCVVAEMRARVPFAYRCDIPIPGEYVGARVLSFRAAAPK